MKFEAIRIIDEYKGELFDWEEVKKIKQEYRDRFAKGDIPEVCKDCPSLKEADWSGTMELKYMLINHWENCHADCVYCHTHENKKELNAMKPWKILPILKDALSKGMLSNNGNVNISGGEPTCLKEFGDLMKFFLEKTNIFIMLNTSAIDYSKYIKKAIEEGRSTATISLDSGTRETYKKVKNVDKFNKVIENIKKYKKGLPADKIHHIGMKYIFIPGYNDNKEELLSWLKLIEDMGLKNIQIELEHHWYEKNKYLPDNVKELIEIVIEFVHRNRCNLSYREILTALGYTAPIKYID
ncbi:MAG: radical SAM protein [Bacilli bacterium]|nr:radical SAM protein [Bacilli bacterium]